MKTSHIVCFTLLLLFIIMFPRLTIAGIVMDCEGTIQSWVLGGYYKSGDCYCSGGQPVCSGKSSGGSSSSGHAGGLSMQNTIKLQMFQGVLDGLVNSMLAPPPKKKHMKPLPPIDNTPGELREGVEENIQRQQFDDNKADLLSDLKGLDSKTLDGDAEALAANARKPFDSALDIMLPVPEATGSATPFFGDTMPVEDIQLLVNPENDPKVVDLRKAKTYVAENIKTDSLNHAASIKPYGGKGNGEPITQSPACLNLAKKLNGFINQRNQFQKTINLSQEQISSWENANRNALLNAAKDGLEYFTGQVLEGLTKRGEAADRLQRIYNKNARQMAQEGLDIKGMEAKIKRLRMLSSAGQVSEFASNISDWQTFIKDGASGLLAQLTSSNQEIQEMLEDPNMQKYFDTESPELKTLLDISKIAASNKVFGKWVVKKVPIIAGVELSINQLYNATDWILSFRRITESNKINGKVLDAARSLQTNIDDTYLALKACP